MLKTYNYSTFKLFFKNVFQKRLKGTPKDSQENHSIIYQLLKPR